MIPTDILLSYCMNVHPIEEAAALKKALRDHAAPIGRDFVGEKAFPVGLWLSRECVNVLNTKGETEALKALLDELKLEAFTVNAFPMGGFHQKRVKEGAYKPTWITDERLYYSQSVAKVLAKLLPESRSFGSMSTVPLSFKPFNDDLDGMVTRIRSMGRFLHELKQESGKEIVLCLEPEPFCVIETSAEAIEFFQNQLFKGPDEAIMREFIGLCFDTCHGAVQWEDLAASIQTISDAGVRIGKAQISVALEIELPGSNPHGLDRLREFDEARYLHQSVGKSGSRALDIQDLFQDGGILKPEWLSEEGLRTHFHVPIFWDGDESLGTTKSSLQGCVPALLRAGCKHFEVETYSWNVIPQRTRETLSSDLNEMIGEELRSARELFQEKL